MPGDLFLATGTFQTQLHHGSLSYSEAARCREVLNGLVLNKFSVGREAQSVLMSDDSHEYFLPLVLRPDRSVITFRRIENHHHGCPEVPDQNDEQRPVRELVRRLETQLAEFTPRSPAATPPAPTAAPPDEPQGVWAAPPAPTAAPPDEPQGVWAAARHTQGIGSPL